MIFLFLFFFCLSGQRSRSIMLVDGHTHTPLWFCHNFFFSDFFRTCGARRTFSGLMTQHRGILPPLTKHPDAAPAAKLFIPLQFRTPVRTHLHTANQRPRVLICIQPIHRGWFNPRYKVVRPPLLPSTARGAVGKATCSTALHCLFSGCEFKSSCWLFFLLW